MNQQRKVLLSVVPFLVGVLIGSVHAKSQMFPDPLDRSPWTQIVNNEDIQVYTMEWPESDFVAIRTEVVVKTTLSKIVANVLDFDSYTSWMKKCKTAQLLKKTPDGFIYYLASDSPWPINDRDFVVYLQFSQDPETRIVTMSKRNHDNFFAENNDHIRVPKLQSVATFIPLDNGHVRMIFQGHSEPGGWLPSWVMNWVTEYVFFNSAKTVRNRLQSPDFQKTVDWIID